jgi:hypothetical protein
VIVLFSILLFSASLIIPKISFVMPLKTSSEEHEKGLGGSRRDTRSRGKTKSLWGSKPMVSIYFS